MFPRITSDMMALHDKCAQTRIQARDNKSALAQILESDRDFVLQRCEEALQRIC